MTTTESPGIRQSEIRQHWPIVLACMTGVGAGIIGLPFYTMGVFVGPIEQEFGWTRASIQGMFSLFVYVGLAVVPIIGWLTAKYGVRRVTLTGLVGTVIGFSCLALLTQSIATFYLSGALLALLGAGTSPITWTTAVNRWFDKQRGLALGITMAGTGIGAFLAPSYVAKLIEVFDWRVAYLGLAAIPALAFPLVYWLLREGPDSSIQTKAKPLEGATVAEALRDYHFWVIAIAFLMVSTGITGCIPNLVPLLLGSGMDTAAAAGIAGLLGLSVVAGRLITGFVIDHVWAPGVSAVVLSAPALAVLVLGQSELNMTLVPMAVILIGLAAGAEFDLIAYLTSRYFGLKNYPKIYSLLYIAFISGAGFAPALFGYFYDVQGSYQTIMRFAAGLFLTGGLLLLTLGRYPKISQSSGH